MSGSAQDAKATLSAILPTPEDLGQQSSQEEANTVLTETETNFELQRREQIIREKDIALEKLKLELRTLEQEGAARWVVLVILGVMSLCGRCSRGERFGSRRFQTRF